MKVIPQNCHCDVILLQLAVALTAMFSTRQELIEACRRLWPECDIYGGGTHIRVTPKKIAGQWDQTSFYVETI